MLQNYTEEMYVRSKVSVLTDDAYFREYNPTPDPFGQDGYVSIISDDDELVMIPVARVKSIVFWVPKVDPASSE
jgi:hypothetical protein